MNLKKLLWKRHYTLCDIRKEIISLFDLYHYLTTSDIIFFVDFLLNESERLEKTEYKIQIMNKIANLQDIDIEEIKNNFKIEILSDQALMNLCIKLLMKY